MKSSEFWNSLAARMITALTSWLVLAICFTCWFLTNNDSHSTNALFYMLMISSGFHLASFIAIGFPFFLMFRPRYGSRVWKLSYGLPVGALLGYFGMWLALTIFGRFILNPIDPQYVPGFLIGSGYGFVTALVACVIRRSYEKAHPIVGKG